MKLICKICGFITEQNVEWTEGPSESTVTAQCLRCSASGSATVSARIAKLRFSTSTEAGARIELLDAINAACRQAKLSQ